MRQKYTYNKLEAILKCSAHDQDFLLRFFSRKTLSERLKIEKMRKVTFHMLKENKKDVENDLLSFAALIMSIRYFYANEKKFVHKTFNELTLEQIRDLTIIKLDRLNDKKYVQKTTKRQKLLHYWSIVKLCRSHNNKPMSFIDISQYLRKNYNFKVSHNLIAQLWKELEINTIEKDI